MDKELPKKSSISDWTGAFVLVLIAMVIISCGVQKDSSLPSETDQKLVVGMELAYPPFEMVDESGAPTGISVEMAEALADSLGKSLEIKNIEFAGLIEALRSDKVDCVISSMTATDERRKTIGFSDGYVSTGLCALINKQSDGISSISDLDKEGVVIAVKQGTTGEIYARGFFKNAKIRSLEKEDACVLEVTQNKASAFIYDQMSIYRHWKRNAETTYPLLNPIQKESWAVGLKHGNEELKAQVNTFLGQFRAEGGFDKLAGTYLAEEQKAFKELGFPFIFDISN